MIEEVVYTSVERGLNPAQSGYCVVAQSQGISADTLDHLIPFTHYEHLPSVSPSPTDYAHRRVETRTGPISCLSRVGDAGLDYSGRNCFLAHHIAIRETDDRPLAGPAWTCALRGLFYKQWKVRPGVLKTRQIPAGNFEISGCPLWKQRVGSDVGAIQLCETIREHTSEPIYIVHEPELRLLPLLVEAIAQLAPELRWRVTFSTCFSSSTNGVECQWRGILKNSARHQEVLEKSLPLIDLT